MGKFRYLVVLSGCILAGIWLAVPVVCSAQYPEGYVFPIKEFGVYVAEPQLDRVAETITWYQGLTGDYDQNGEVNLADLSALVRHFGESNPDGWPVESIQSVLDGDGNGEINSADITTIAKYFGLAADRFELFYSDYPTSRRSVRGEGVLVVPYSSGIGNPLNERLKYEVNMFIGPSPFFDIFAANEAELVGMSGYPAEVLPRPSRSYTPFYGLAWDSESQELSWFRNIHGDGNLDGEVNFVDQAMVEQHYGEFGEPGSDAWHADYDGNSEVNLADITLVAVNWGATVDGFLIYATSNPDELPEHYSYPILAPIAQYSAVSQVPGGSVVISPESGDYIWIRPYVGDPGNPVNVAAPSEFVLVP